MRGYLQAMGRVIQHELVIIGTVLVHSEEWPLNPLNLNQSKHNKKLCERIVVSMPRVARFTPATIPHRLPRRATGSGADSTSSIMPHQNQLRVIIIYI